MFTKRFWVEIGTDFLVVFASVIVVGGEGVVGATSWAAALGALLIAGRRAAIAGLAAITPKFQRERDERVDND